MRIAKKKHARENCGNRDDEQYMQIQDLFIRKKAGKTVDFFLDAMRHISQLHNLFE